MTSQPATKTINAEDFQAEAEDFFTLKTKITHDVVLREILDNLQPIVFRDVAELKPEEEITQKIQIVLTVREVLKVANDLNCGLCLHLGFIYSYNGERWNLSTRKT